MSPRRRLNLERMRRHKLRAVPRRGWFVVAAIAVDTDTVQLIIDAQMRRVRAAHPDVQRWDLEVVDPSYDLGPGERGEYRVHYRPSGGPDE